MPLIKSNSVLVAFDNSYQNNPTEFEFLNFVQSTSLDIATNRLNQKSLGREDADVPQFVAPEVLLGISYLQRVDFFNEFLMGFSASATGESKSFAKKLIDGFYNRNVFIIISDLQGSDLAYQVSNGNFNGNMITMSIGNVFLNSYSFSYKVGSLPVTNVSLTGSEMKAANVTSSSGMNLQNWDGSTILLDSTKVTSFLNATNNNKGKNITYHMKNLAFSNTFSSTSTPAIIITDLLSGLISSLDFSVDFARTKYYFFESGNSPTERKISPPVNCSFRISGTTKAFQGGAVSTMFNQDQKFNITLSIGELDPILSTQNPPSFSVDYTEITLENVSVDKFAYALDSNGMMSYVMDCQIQITQDSGFKINPIQTKDESITYLVSSDSSYIVGSDPKFLAVRN